VSNQCRIAPLAGVWAAFNAGVAMSEWKYVGHCVEGDRLVIDSLNVWDYKWVSVTRKLGPAAVPPGIDMPPLPEENMRIVVKDPTYGHELTFHVYEITDGSRRVEFAAGEFSNLVYGFYVREGA
jgi:hypothetical protein